MRFKQIMTCATLALALFAVPYLARADEKSEPTDPGEGSSTPSPSDDVDPNAPDEGFPPFADDEDEDTYPGDEPPEIVPTPVDSSCGCTEEFKEIKRRLHRARCEQRAEHRHLICRMAADNRRERKKCDFIFKARLERCAQLAESVRIRGEGKVPMKGFPGSSKKGK